MGAEQFHAIQTASMNAESIVTSNETDLSIITNGSAVFKAGALSTQGSLDLVIQYGDGGRDTRGRDAVVPL
jgi:hypothetical protein